MRNSTLKAVTASFAAVAMIVSLTYLVANAVSLTASPYLARRFGRKAFFLICLALFTVASIGSAEAWSLDSLDRKSVV